ncbi:MAG TPA: heparan-alpha-glucosaminide N-acetyltransferase domain-containing protein [Steroidobacteraceae bacterium]|nr:heparan-alpha-glucosaminide N-acetyltransferase domain-containing protein [Steroidobacteraceae bacterium]
MTVSLGVPPRQRWTSVDALRGLTVAAMLIVNNPGDWSHVYAPLRHASWHGCTPADLIFPCFLFVVGVSLALSIGARLAAGAVLPELDRALAGRALRIIALGLVLHALAWWALATDHFRPPGVLQRIGLCVLVSGWLAIHARPLTQWMIAGALLVGYWLLLSAGGTLEPWTNLASRIDTLVLGRHAYEFDSATGRAHDPEGLLSTVPAIATTLLGVRAGAWLRSGELRKTILLGIGALAAGLLWSTVFPFNKNLWTSSYALWSAGWACLALAVLHMLIDRYGWPALGRSLGVNAIAIYAGSAALVYVLIACGWLGPLYEHTLARWLTPALGPHAASLAWALAFTALWWLAAWVLDRRRIYWKI